MSDVKVTVGADASELEREMNRAAASVKRFQGTSAQAAAGMREAEKAASAQASKTMQLAFAVDDLQYGMRGIGNNIPMIVQALGGSMGLAGGLSIAATAGYALYKVLDQVTGRARDREMTEAMTEAIRNQKDALIDLQNELTKAARSEFLRASMVLSLRKQQEVIGLQLGVDEARFAILEKSARLQHEAARAEKELLTARLKVQGMIQEPGVSTTSFKSQANFQMAQKEVEQINKQIELLKEKEALANRQKEQAAQNGSGLTSSYAIQASEAQFKIDQQRKKLGELKTEEAKLNAAREVLKANPPLLPTAHADYYSQLRALNDEDIKNQTARNRAEQILEQAEAEKRVQTDLLKSAQDTAEATQKQMEAKALAARDEIEALSRLKASKQELNDLERQALTLEAEKAVAAERAKKAEDAGSKNAAWTALMQQLEISRFIAKGDTEKAESLRREISLRRETSELAKATGQDEKKILDQLRERERNMALGDTKKNAKQKRFFNAAESAARRAARLSKADKDRGRMSNTDKLAEENQRRRDQQRADRVAAENKAVPGDKILEKILEAEKRQVEVWDRLTTKSL